MALNKETTAWIDVDHTTSKKLAKAYADYRKAQDAANAARVAMETIKTDELRSKMVCPLDMSPIYSHKFGKWTAAAEKGSGDLIVQRQRSSGGTKRSI